MSYLSQNLSSKHHSKMPSPSNFFWFTMSPAFARMVFFVARPSPSTGHRRNPEAETEEFDLVRAQRPALLYSQQAVSNHQQPPATCEGTSGFGSSRPVPFRSPKPPRTVPPRPSQTLPSKNPRRDDALGWRPSRGWSAPDVFEVS